jgi:hypothetical protein
MMWGLTRVLANVIDEVFLTRKRFRAVVATVRRFAGVPHDVIFKMVFTREILATYVAVEGRVGDVGTAFGTEVQHQAGERFRRFA